MKGMDACYTAWGFDLRVIVKGKRGIATAFLKVPSRMAEGWLRIRLGALAWRKSDTSSAATTLSG
jgi:hypothetical protein